MWILFGAKTKSKVVEGGRRGERRCGECAKQTVWVECDVKDSFNLFLVDVFDTTSRCMRCSECGEDCSIDQWDAEHRRATNSLQAPRGAQEGGSPAVTAKKTAAPVDVDVEAEFAALKRRLNKG
jgi:hypothetical protein